MFAEAKAHRELHRCGICGEPGRPGEQWVVDHITPASEGGASTRDNLRLAHYICNLRRGAQLGAKRAAERRREKERASTSPRTATIRGGSNHVRSSEDGPHATYAAIHPGDGCPIIRADPSFQPEWQEVETSHGRRECQCYAEDHWEAAVDRRPRLDSLDPATFRHMGQCEYRDATDPAILRAILRVRDNLGWDYWFVECSICGAGWQVSYYAAESAG